MEHRFSPQEIAADILRRQRMRRSLVAFAESIQIPGAPLVDEGDVPFELHDGSITTLNEIDSLSMEIEGWARKKETIKKLRGEYSELFAPIGSSLALHHRVLLEKIQACMETRYGRLMVFMPPGSAKSTYATVLAPTWAMGVNPGLQIILASYATPIAKKLGSKGRFIIEQDVYGAAFRDAKDQPVRLDPKTQAKEMWAITNGSQYMSGGLLSGLTGNRAGGVIIDDPVKGRQAADSPTERANTLQAFEDDLTTRMIPGAWMILIQTRWNPEDLAGAILPDDYAGESGQILCKDGMVWEVLNIPGKAEFEDDPLGREVGEYLWPEWFDEKFWQMYEPKPGEENVGKHRRWAALFQQRPRPDEGNMFEEAWFNRYEVGVFPPTLNMYAASDYATKEAEGDYTEHGVAGLDKDGSLWIVDWFGGQVTTDIGIAAWLRLCKKYGVKQAFDEKGIIHNAIEPAKRRKMREEGYQVHTELLPSAGRKESKWLSFQSLASSGKVWIPNCPWGDALIDQLLNYHAHDDKVDVCGLFGRACEEMVWSHHKVIQRPERGLRFGSVEWLEYEDKKKKRKNNRVF